MSTTTEDRIVRMKFDNASFKKGAIETKESLDKIDAAVANAGKGRGLLDMAGHMQSVTVKAGAMQVAVVTALATIVTKAVDAGIRIAKSLTVDPLTQGFGEYELKMKSIQTILANTDGENLKSVTKVLNQLNDYADKTIYNFGNMTDAIGKMTTAGIGLEVATATVKGFHNMVALSGGDAAQAAGALEQFNQGLQTGVIKLIDWKSLQTRGLGSKALQESFFETARAAGSLGDVPLSTTFEEWAKANGGFNATLESGWLTADVATKTYAIMGGEIKTVQELMDMGFSEQTAKDMLQIAKDAEESATKVRTLTAFMGTLKEQVGSGFAQIFEILFGDFNEATNLFSGLSDATGAFVGKFFTGLEKILNVWDKLGGRMEMFTTLQHILAPFGAIFGLIAKGFDAAFGGKKGGSALKTFTGILEHMTRPLNILAKLIKGQLTPLEALKRLYDVFAHGLRNVVKILPDLSGPLDKLFGKVPNGDNVLTFIKDLAREVREAVEDVKELVKGTGKIGDVFDGFKMPDLGGIFGKDEPSKLVGFAGAIKSGVSQTTGGAFSQLPKHSDGPMFNPDADISAGRVNDITGEIATAVDNFKAESEGVRTTGEVFKDTFSGVLGAVKDFFGNFNFDDLVASFNLAVLATFMISISRFFNTLTKSFKGFVGVGESINSVLSSAGDALGSFQTAARAKLITAIAIAIGILAVSLWILSRIPADKMVTGLAGMAGIMLIMKVGIDSIAKAVEKMDGKGTALKLTGLSLALLALGAAVLMLTGAFLLMKFVKWEDMLKGLIMIRVVMVSMERLGALGEHAAKNMFAGAAAIALIAGSMIVLAGALLLFKLVEWEDMAKAGIVLGVLALVVAGLAMIPYAGIEKVGLALLGASVGMLAIANALVIFAIVKWESIGKAAVILGAITLALAALMFVGGGPVGAASILAIAGAMIMLATAGLILNKVNWSSIGKLALVLTVLIVGFTALLAVITIFAPAIILLSAFAGSIALLALALAGLALAFAVIFPLFALGAGAFAAFATGAAVAFAVFATTLAAEAPIIKDAFLKILQVLIDGIVEAVPMVMQGFEDLWTAIKAQFSGSGKGSGQMTTLMGNSGKSWMEKLKDGILKKLPAIIDTGLQVILKFLGGIGKRAGELGAKGAILVANLINGIASKSGRIVDSAVNLIVKFAEGIGNNLPKIVTAGIQLISDWLHALADGIRGGAGKIGNGLKDVGDAFFDVGKNIVQGLIDGMKSLASKPLEWIDEIVGALPGWAKKMLGIASPSKVFMKIGAFLVEGLTKGIQIHAASAIVAVASMVSGQIAVASQYISDFVQKLDQQALAASAKATGLQRAADAAAKAAEKTKKNKKDDRSAKRLDEKADRAARKAERLEAKADKAEAESERAAEFEDATLLEKAQMRSEDAQNQMDAAKAAEFNAAAKLAEAQALREQANAKGVSKKDAKEMREQAKKLEEQAKKQAKEANEQIALARLSAQDALALQKAAGEEAAAAFQAQFEAEAKADADVEAFKKLTDSQKAQERRRQAAELQAKANKDLQDAKVLAYTDLEAANALAQEAMDQAEQARQYLLDAADYEKNAAQGTGAQTAETGGTVVNLDPTEAASIAFNQYANKYSAGTAAAAATRTVELNQYNSSPEPLSPAEVYRRTQNLLEFAADRVAPTAA